MTPGESQYVIQTLTGLEACSFEEEMEHSYHLLLDVYGLSYSPTVANRVLIEKFLDAEAYCAMLNAEGLKVLCHRNYWGLTMEYKPLLLQSLQHLDDSSLYLQNEVAIDCFGQHINKTHDKETLAMLYETFCAQLQLHIKQSTISAKLSGNPKYFRLCKEYKQIVESEDFYEDTKRSFFALLQETKQG